MLEAATAACETVGLAVVELCRSSSSRSCQAVKTVPLVALSVSVAIVATASDWPL